MSPAPVLTDLKRADGVREHSMCLILEQQRNLAKLFCAWHWREKPLILPNPHSDELARETSCTVSRLGQGKGIFGNHLPKRFNRQQFQSSESVRLEAWLMSNSVRGVQRLQHCGRLGVERVFKLRILVGVLEFNILIENWVVIVCFHEQFTCQVSLRFTAQLLKLGIKNASVRNFQPGSQWDKNTLFQKRGARSEEEEEEDGGGEKDKEKTLEEGWKRDQQK